MPELPEVETIRRGLEPHLVGSRIESIEILFTRSMPANDQLLSEHVHGSLITSLRRRGKVMIIELSTGYSLLVHLKMTGQLILEEHGGDRFGGGHPTRSMERTLPDRSTRAIIYLENGNRLFFNDQRKFGWIKLLKTSEVEQDSLLARMGVEPLSTDFTYSHFKERIVRRKSSIKAVLLDQSTVAGLGNIYVDEALHLAKIHPQRQASDLTEVELKRLHEAIITIIGIAIDQDGTTFRDYMNHRGEMGNYFEYARVFNRTGLACPECGATIVKLRVASRGTHVCPQCQILK